MKLKYLLVSLATALLLTSGVVYAKKSNKSSLVKGKPYYLENATVVLKVKRLGGDKKIKYTSEEELNTSFNTYLRESLRAANLLADKPEDAQANLSVTLNFTRTFVAFTNRRMNPLINYKMTGHKGDEKVLVFFSGKLVNTKNMYNKKSDTAELEVTAYLADQMVKKLQELEK